MNKYQKALWPGSAISFENRQTLMKAHVLLQMQSPKNPHTRSIEDCDCEIALVYKLTCQEYTLLDARNMAGETKL